MTSAQFARWRAGKDISQAEAARRLRVALGTVKAWEQGRNRVPRIAEALISALDQIETLTVGFGRKIQS